MSGPTPLPCAGPSPAPYTLSSRFCDQNPVLGEASAFRHQPLLWATLCLLVRSCSARENTCTQPTPGPLQLAGLAFRPLCERTQVHRPSSVRGRLSKNHTEDSTYTWTALACQGLRRGSGTVAGGVTVHAGFRGPLSRAFLSRKERLQTEKQHPLTRGERRGAHRAELWHAHAGHWAARPAQRRKATGRFRTPARSQGPLHRPRSTMPPSADRM